MKLSKKIMGVLGALMIGVTAFAVPNEVKADSYSVDVTADAENVSVKKGDTFSATFSYKASGENVRALIAYYPTYDAAKLEPVGEVTHTDINADYETKTTSGYEFVSFSKAKALASSGSFTMTFKALADCDIAADTLSMKMQVAIDAESNKCDDSASVKVTFDHLDANKKEETVEATCITDGYKNVVCTKCNEEFSNTVLKADGKHVWDDGTETPATCTEKGQILYKCTRDSKCTETKTTHLEKLPHALDDGTVTVPATCSATGLKVYACKNCTYTEEEVLKKLEHTWNDGEVTKDATCTEAGSKQFSCTECKETKTETIEASGHTWIVDKDTDKDGWRVTKAATAAAEGTKERTCSECEEVETAVIAKLTATVTPGTDNKTTAGTNNTTGTSNNSTSSGSTTKVNSTKTGDSAMTGLYVMLLAVTAAVCGGVVIFKRRRVSK